MRSLVRFRFRTTCELDAELDAEDMFQQRVEDCSRNGTRVAGGDVFDEMVARIKTARCYLLSSRICADERGRPKPQSAKRIRLGVTQATVFCVPLA